MAPNVLPQNVGVRRLLRLPEVLAALGGMHKTTVYGLIREGQFPAPIKIGGSSRWPSDDIATWIDSRPKGTVARRKSSGC